jgi:hypothetical protein
MTRTWKRFGLEIEQGLNHFTMGKVVNGMSSRFDRTAPEYQSWLGGYTVKLDSDKPWDFEDHFKLAIADQNSWLRRYGDPAPKTNIAGFKFTEVSKIQLGEYAGTLYEFGCRTHSDVGTNPKTFKLLYGIYGMEALFNLYNPNLGLKAKALLPRSSQNPYEPLELRGFFAIFDIEPRVKAVLYGNGAVVPGPSSQTDTFEVLKPDLLAAMESCEIIPA